MPTLKASTSFQQTAALRVQRNVTAMGPLGQMERSDTAREQFMGSKYKWPLFDTSTPMKKLNNALALARDIKSAGDAAFESKDKAK